METNDVKNTISALIIDNKLIDALTLLKNSFQESEVELINEVILLESKLRELVRHERVGDISRESILSERNSIKLSVLNLVGELDRFGKQAVSTKEIAHLGRVNSWYKNRKANTLFILFSSVVILSLIAFFVFKNRSDVPKQYDFPIKIAVFGPISGDLKNFGLSHARGITGACMHFLKEVIDEDPERISNYFTFTYYDTGDPNGQFVKNRDKLETDYITAQKTHDFVFGPLSSEIAKELLLTRRVKLSVPTFITIASSPAIRQHPQYGKLLFQLSNNIDSYSRQIMSYFANFSKPRPKYVFCIARNDEYGTSSSKAISKYAIENNLAYSQIEYNINANFQTNTQGDTNMISFIEKIKEQGEDAVVMVIAVGDDLLRFFNLIKEKAPAARISTLSSIERELIKKGHFNDAFLIYSYVPGSVTLQTLRFYRSIKLAEVALGGILDSRHLPAQWHDPSTADAEVHDATIYFLSTYCMESFKKKNTNWASDFYALCVTDFMLSKKENALSNEGSLFIFQIKNAEMLPVKTDY